VAWTFTHWQQSRVRIVKSEIAEAYGAKYISTKQTSLHDLTKKVGRPDIIFECTGNAEACFRAMEVLNLNGALVWTSITGGSHKVRLMRRKINLEWVAGE